MSDQSDFSKPGVVVYLRDNPGRVGKTTGRTRTAGSFPMAEVEFGPTDRQFKRCDLLELFKSTEDPHAQLRKGAFGQPSDIRRVLTFEKIKGDLTNVFYSMEASNTDFYAHQFKPVMRFIESSVGRLLIADEVGLGKTIEATYAWKELQAREGARRLLVVCPSMLREKWRTDLRNRFNISAEVVSAKQLHEKLADIAQRRAVDPFTYITSLEGVRAPSSYEELSNDSVKARLARLLDANTASEEFALLDLVVIDEAHYLRNPSTANNRAAHLLRDASRHLILLTATPIQLRSENLYQLLRLIDPDQFYDAALFEDILRANSQIVRAQRALWQNPPDLAGAIEAVSHARMSEFFKNDTVLERVKSTLDGDAAGPEQRIEILRLLESRSLLSQSMTRSRKREVLENRVERGSQVLNITLNPAEKELYDHVTRRIRLRSVGKSGPSLFSLVARQRQMASSIVGALESWNDRGQIDELLWEDIGAAEGLAGEWEDEALGGDAEPIAFGHSFDVKDLEANDSKYRELQQLLKRELSRNPAEKFVVFAFFRGTLKYLARRLNADGIRAVSLMGGMGDEKDSIITEFARDSGPSVLLSSEVGSEGIDLQFCRFVVNYDLPWNPMKVEQRIGRIDRLGQKAQRITIISLALANTIEDRILMRLYERINIFRESIGDLEEILGEVSEQLLVDLLAPDLSDAERERKAVEAEMALQNKLRQHRELEQEAVNLVGFSDYIMSQINRSREQGRWLSATELMSLVDDFFAQSYPGTQIEPHDRYPGAIRLSLSDEARRDLGSFIDSRRPATRTRLNRSSQPVVCVFEPRQAGRIEQDAEMVEPSHPLIQWIRAHYDGDPALLHRVVALKLPATTGVLPGDYVFCAYRWSFSGIKQDHLMAFSGLRIGDAAPLGGMAAESLIARAARDGLGFPNAANLVVNLADICYAADACEERLMTEFGERSKDFEAENSLRCAQQETSARKFTSRRVEQLEKRIDDFRRKGDERLIPATQGLIRREQELLSAKLSQIAQKRIVDPSMALLALGVIRVE